MEIMLGFGGVVFRIIVAKQVFVSDLLSPFRLSNVEKVDVTVRFSWEWDSFCLPQSECIGFDGLLEYYQSEKGRYVLTTAGGGTYQACAEYTRTYKYIECRINDKICPSERINLETMLRFLPLRAVFDYFGILLFHASQIAFQDKGILFTAPSGTGKTTQAKLWRDNRNAEILCNDRTLVRCQRERSWLTYGYILDGSEPVRSNQATSLACIVVLQQGMYNKIERLRGGKAVAALMSQLVLDAWDAETRTRTIEVLIKLLEMIPVYQLSCTPRVDAVDFLEEKLIEDGVIEHGYN